MAGRQGGRDRNGTQDGDRDEHTRRKTNNAPSHANKQQALGAHAPARRPAELPRIHASLWWQRAGWRVASGRGNAGRRQRQARSPCLAHEHHEQCRHLRAGSGRWPRHSYGPSWGLSPPVPSLARSLSLPLLSPFIVAWLPTTVFSCSRHVFSCSRHGAWLARATFDGSRLSALLPCAPYVLCEGNGSGCKWSMWCLRVSILPASFVCVMCLCMPVSACLCLCEWGVYVGTGQRRGGGGEQEGQGIV